MLRAIVRGISPRFAEATVASAPAIPIDVDRARDQHAAYVVALRSLGVEVHVLPAATDLPDCCFVEDQAVVREGVALITRSGCEARRPEAVVVRQFLERHLVIHEMQAPASLDGGDVLGLGRTLFVGRSARTNREGVATLARVFGPLGYEVVEVALPKEVLHLKCVCAPLGDARLLLAEGALDPAPFARVGEIVWAPAAESYAANVVAIGDRILVAAGHPGTAAALRAAGLVPVPLQTSELAKADGSLTCLSVSY